VPLNVIGEAPSRVPIARSRNARRRAIVLAVVQLLLIAHIVQWAITGRTVSPIEPSESMQTLELGYVNAGFILFAAALLATLVFGRFFCGWGCHLVLLQDGCAWIMKRMGVRPKAFRSRVLVYVPLVLALYMFVWPSFKRLGLIPILERWWPDALPFLKPVPEFPGFTNHLVTTGFWDTYAPWVIAIPFLGVCGFATVYFLLLRTAGRVRGRAHPRDRRVRAVRALHRRLHVQRARPR
jgi:polyferredoxin